MKLAFVDRAIGTGRTGIYVDGDGNVMHRYVDDPTPIIDMNKRAQCDDQPVNKLGTLLARIPLIIVEKWKHEYGIDVLNDDHMPDVMRMLNSRDWRWLKATEEVL